MFSRLRPSVSAAAAEARAAALPKTRSGKQPTLKFNLDTSTLEDFSDRPPCAPTKSDWSDCGQGRIVFSNPSAYTQQPRSMSLRSLR